MNFSCSLLAAALAASMLSGCAAPPVPRDLLGTPGITFAISGPWANGPL